jgi:hypothetical protein
MDSITNILSFLLGLGIALILFKLIQKRTCIILDNKSVDVLTNHVQTHDGKCYKYSKKEVGG